jgi:hypothetical protein
MTYIKINDTLYPATISGRMKDAEWDNRESKAITLEMDYATASALFVDGLAWSIVQEHEEPIIDENGEQTGTETKTDEYDNTEYCLAGDIIDHRDGTVTCKMGKLTELEEAYEMMLGGM